MSGPRLPPPGEHPPGERRVSTARPESWTIERDGSDGLAFEAYATHLRAPYLQRVTPQGATILWRVNPPGDPTALARPLDALRPGEPFALRVDGAGYLGYVDREVGVNLGWCDHPWAQWELHGDAVRLAAGHPVALWNRAASDYLVHARRRRGIDLGWLTDTRRRSPAEWRVRGAPPRVWLEHSRKRGAAHLVYRRRRYGVNLGWAARPPAPNLILERLHLDATVTVAPVETPLEQGRRFCTADGSITVSEVSWTYRYRPGVESGRDVKPDLPNLRLWAADHRPTLQCEARLTGLEPGRVYHYRVICPGRDPQTAPPPGAPDVAAPALTLADDVTFRTAPGPDRPGPVRWLAMGDLGPGKWKPSYAYDVCDLFCEVARRHDAQLWLPLGDLDNDTNGHPNAMDPFFFNVYNAHRGPSSPRTTSADRARAADTLVGAFANAGYYGLLGGLPTFPTFGNHDICLPHGGSADRFRQAYLGNFALPGPGEAWSPAAREFNAAGRGLFYTFRWGRVIFLSLGLPCLKGCRISLSEGWHRRWGRRQEKAVVRLLGSLGQAVSAPDVWVVAYFHDHHAGMDPPGRGPWPRLLLQHGVDLALTGHRHTFEAHDIVDGERHLRTLVVGTGGFGDPDPGDHCRRPGFVLLEVEGDTLRYWKYDTHRCAPADPADPHPRVEGTPLGRDAVHWHIREHCRMRKTGPSAHVIEEERDLHVPV